jgi:hypothetical protein
MRKVGEFVRVLFVKEENLDKIFKPEPRPLQNVIDDDEDGI